LPSARSCYQLAPKRTFTSNSMPMPGTPTGNADLIGDLILSASPVYRPRQISREPNVGGLSITALSPLGNYRVRAVDNFCRDRLSPTTNRLSPTTNRLSPTKHAVTYCPYIIFRAIKLDLKLVKLFKTPAARMFFFF
jgi:hypothetical protein